MRVNPPALQLAPVVFVGVCLIGAGYSVQSLLTMEPGTEQWQVGILGLAIFAAGFAFIDGGWLYIQREVDFGPEGITVRRWIEVLFDRPGHTLPLDGRTRAALTLKNLRSLVLSRDGIVVNRITLGYWAPRHVRELIDGLRTSHVELDQYWDGEYPPWTS
jgi:hypothetical protein